MLPYQVVINALQQLVDSGECLAASAIITDHEGVSVTISVPVRNSCISACPWSGYVSAGNGLSEPGQTSRANR